MLPTQKNDRIHIVIMKFAREGRKKKELTPVMTQMGLLGKVEGEDLG